MPNMDSTIDNTEDIIDVRDVIARFENLQASIDWFVNAGRRPDDEEVSERDTLGALLDELASAGDGGDVQWEGEWYPITLIRDSYFKAYAQEFAEDIGALNPKASWPYNCIDWSFAARELQMDYTSVEYDGVTYWYR